MVTQVPIDRGWAWVITLAVFCTNILCVGYFRAFGVFFVEIIDTFNSSSSLTSLIMGMQNAVFCVTALLVHNVLLDVIEVRTCAVFGGFIMATGMMLGMFAHSVPFLIFTLSVLVGLGNAFTYGPGIVLIGQYFNRRRALANSLASMGASVGSMALPVMATFLVVQYGLRGALLLYGAVTFHICIFASLYRPLSAADIAASLMQYPDSSELESGTDAGKALLGRQSGKPDEIVEPDSDEPGQVHEGKQLSVPQESSALTEQTITFKADTHENVLSKSQESSLYSSSLPKINILLGSMPLVKERDDSLADVDLKRLLLKTAQGDPRQFSSTGNMCAHSGVLYDDTKRSLTQMDIRSPSLLQLHQQGKASPTGSQLRLRLENAALRLSQPQLLVHPPFIDQKPPGVFASSDVTDSDDVSANDVESTCRQSPCRRLRERVSCDGKLLRKPMFWLVQFYTCVGVMGATGAGSYVPVLMQEKGLTKNETALTLTIWGAFNLLGRLSSGLIADRELLRPANISALAFTSIGVLFASISYIPHTLTAMCVFSATFGLFEGVYFSMLPDIIIGFVGLQDFSRTFGFAQLSQGAFAAFLYPILGGLKDVTGSYHATFYLLGACAITATFLLLLVPVLRTLKQCRSRGQL
ncbi:monocarboxylate transporter 5-like [Littorina saxatilis]|uniref:Uncharacterized protein n=1 Tax=Littorina saxatilis TaxID=31220 RepID=A0AAN9G3T8_9CAEN